MTDDNLKAATSGNSNLKYGAIGLLLLVGALGLYFGTQKNEPPPPVPKTVEAPKRQTALADPEFVIPDAEDPDAAKPAPTATKTKIIYKYVDEWDCAGELSKDDVSRAMADYRAEVRVCYEKRLKANNTLQGNMTVNLKIGAGGEASSVQTRGNIKDPELTSCIKTRAARWKFTSPKGGGCAVISVPFNLTPSS